MTLGGPLSDIVVIEFGNFVAGPTSGQLLTDLGANVIKIEPPVGEPWRHSSDSSPKGESRLFIALNRGKKSVCIDLKTPEGQKVCHDIVAKADAVISNNRTDTSEKLKYDWKTLSKINPKLAGIENKSESSKDLFCIWEIFFTLFFLNAFERTGKETVPTAIPAIARLIW